MWEIFETSRLHSPSANEVFDTDGTETIIITVLCRKSVCYVKCSNKKRK